MRIVWYSLRIEKSSYKIYEDRIDFFNENTISSNETVNLDDVVQVRYEDEFGKGYQHTSWLIYIYLKEDHNLKYKRIKKDRISLIINPKTRVNDIIEIMKFFKRKDKQIYILTKYKSINEKLGIRNWNNP